ncbi:MULTISPECIES: HNH endonuclease [Rhodopseudomonas]|uniref:HNH endonuclease n=1 Tax=Rhodopseudomonas TaxID=1073 RepID=UPI001364CE9F|nr:MULTISPECIES: HNH endonuclease [Rhodopseudomonas]MDF3813299.1 HNH endonuclease [Rhodopseudomonas sp. BAL398]WOK20160.1 HNH endonuclease [Rhodopseudomonas sp. BAL398]
MKENPLNHGRICIYCLQRKASADFSLEHIIPRFMGGNGTCADATTREVCRKCNSLMGRFVDAPVAKGFFQNSIENRAWQHCLDFDEASGNVFPLTYFGKSKEITFGPDEEVEVWLCPDGGTVWHIHTKQPEDYDAMAGGDPFLSRKDAASRVYAFNASPHPYWLFSNFKSVTAHFSDEPIFLGADSDIEDQLLNSRTGGKLCKKDAIALRERDFIRALLDKGGRLGHELKLDLLFDIRFLAKLALAFGYRLLGERFGRLQYTNRLRNLLWTRRSDIPSTSHDIRMMSYFQGLGEKSPMKSLSIPLGFVFLLSSFKEGIVLSIVFPSGHSTQVSITDPTIDPEAISFGRTFQDRVLVSIPQLTKIIGPFRPMDYIAWVGGQHKIPELDQLMNSITIRSLLPSLR